MRAKGSNQEKDLLAEPTRKQIYLKDGQTLISAVAK